MTTNKTLVQMVCTSGVVALAIDPLNFVPSESCQKIFLHDLKTFRWKFRGKSQIL